jgi:hypothetical protein
MVKAVRFFIDILGKLNGLQHEDTWDVEKYWQYTQYGGLFLGGNPSD